MKTIPYILAIMFILLLAADAGPHHVTKIRNITGTVTDYDKSKGMLVLRDYTDWDREQMNDAKVQTEMRQDKRLIAWLNQQDKKDAVIWVRKDDLRGVRKGTRLTISGYHYIIDERTVIPAYDKLEITPYPHQKTTKP